MEHFLKKSSLSGLGIPRSRQWGRDVIRREILASVCRASIQVTAFQFGLAGTSASKRGAPLPRKRWGVGTSVTRLGAFLDFKQVFKAFGNNYFDQISHILRQFL